MNVYGYCQITIILLGENQDYAKWLERQQI